MKRQFRLVNDTVRHNAMRYVQSAPDGFTVTIAPETRRDAQNRLLHAIIQDVRDQVPDVGQYSMEDAKLRFMHAFRQEGRWLPELEGPGQFPVGQRTSLLGVRQFAALCEVIFAYGASKGVKWSKSAQDSFNEAKR